MISPQEAAERVANHYCLMCGQPVAPSAAVTLNLTLTQPNGDSQRETAYFHRGCFAQLSESLHRMAAISTQTKEARNG